MQVLFFSIDPDYDTLTLKSGDYHLVLKQLAHSPVVGERVVLYLSFERAGELKVDAEVRSGGQWWALQQKPKPAKMDAAGHTSYPVKICEHSSGKNRIICHTVKQTNPN